MTAGSTDNGTSVANGRVVVVTGGNRGLGLHQTRRFLEAGDVVHVVARSAGEIAELGSSDRLHVHKHDLTDWSDTGFLDAVHTREGRLDVLINNAGVHLKKPAWEVEPEELDRVLDVNVKAMMTACGRFVALHRETGAGEGAIVNLSSMGGLMALPNSAAYVRAKTAVIGLTRSLAVDAAPFGVRCNAVCPGFIDTDMTRAILARDPERRERIERRIPSHSFGTPENVANAVHFLASAAARYVNGVSLPVDGGYAVGF